MTIAAVQRVSKGFSGASSCAIGSGDGWATPTSGNLLVLTINCDRLCSTPSGYTAGSPVEDDNAVYLFWKISAGTETTPTITPIGGTTTGVMTACEYSGVAASPADGSNTSSIVGSVGTTTTSTSVTTTAAGDLIIAVAGLAHYTAGVAAPSSPSWTNSFVNQITVDVGSFTSNHACTFYAELIAGAAGSYSTSCSWTTGMLERQELIAAFTAAAATATEVAGPYRGPAPGRISPTGQWMPFRGADPDVAQTIQGVASLTGAGTVTDIPAIQGATATATGAGAVSASGVIAGSATLTGAGTLAATVTQAAGSSPTGAGTLTGAATESATATPTGAGTLAALATEGATATLTGAGTLTSPAVQRVTATLTGAGVLTASAGAGAIQGVASLTAAGTLAATATQAATATAVGAGVLSAKATQGTIVTLTGTGALTGSVVQGAVAALAGAGTIDATGTGATHNATSGATVTAAYTSTDTVVAGRTSTGGISAGRTSASGVSATRTSASSTTAGRTSTPDVSDG